MPTTKARTVIPSTRIELPNRHELVNRYVAGESEKALAVEAGISRGVMRRYLIESGIQPRNRSGGMYSRMARTSAVERQRLAAAAHAAARNRIVPFEEKCFLAKLKETDAVDLPSISRHEMFVRHLLQDRQIPFVAQKAEGPFNIDIALVESLVAIEIFGGGWHGYGSHAKRFRPRMNHLMQCGWTPIVVWVDDRYHPLGSGAFEYILNIHRRILSREISGTELHVIRGDGKGGTAGHFNPENGIPIIRGCTCGGN